MYEMLVNINRLQQCHYGEPQVTESTDPEKFEKLKKEWEVSFQSFSGFDLEKINQTDMKAMIQANIDRAKVKIVLSFLKPEFVTKYEDEFTMSDPTVLIQQLTNIIGEPDKSAQTEKLRRKFHEMVRRTENSETFTAYLERLTNVVNKLTNEASTRKYLLRQQFRDSLSPPEKSFITVHGNEEEEVKQQAKLLDDKKQFIFVPSVNAVNTNRVEELERFQSDFVSELNRLSSSVLQLQTVASEPKQDSSTMKLDELSHQIQNMNSCIGQVMQVHNTRGRGRGSYGSTRGRGGSYAKRPTSSNIDWTIRCLDCGLRGHHAKDCRPKKHMKCYKCGVMGHTQFAKKFHPEDQKN